MSNTASLLEGRRIVVLGATGPIGTHLVNRMAEGGIAVTATARTQRSLWKRFADLPTVTSVATDINDAAVTSRLVASADGVILAAGVDPADLDQQIRFARSIEPHIEASRRVIYVSSCWSFSPLVREVVDEDHPRPGGLPAAAARKAAEDLLTEAGATVLHLPDFYGPLVHTSPLQRAIVLGRNGQTISSPASMDVEREYAYVSDTANVILATMAATKIAGRRFVVPGSGQISVRRIVAILDAELGRPVRVRSLGHVPIRIARLVDEWTRYLGPAAAEYRKPVRYDAAALRKVIGDLPTTGYLAGIQSTLAWLEQGEDR